ncbi:hypothetical protein JCM3765_004803 [Sporobolomyces pararoseus]
MATLILPTVFADHSADRFERQRRHEALASQHCLRAVTTQKTTTTTEKITSTSTKKSSTKASTTTRALSTSRTSVKTTSSVCQPSTKVTTKTVTVTKSQIPNPSKPSTVTVTKTLTLAPPSSVSSSTTFLSSYPTPTGNTTCAATYKPKTGIFIDGTGTLPKPTSFVKKEKNSSALTLDGKPFRIVGPNMYWLAEDENVNNGSWTSKPRIREALAIAVGMGANTVRALSLASSVGNSTQFHLKPTLDTWNEKAWDVRDYAIYAAREYGLRVVLTLSGNYDGPHGGKYTWLRWLNVTEENKGSKFYHEPKVINAFEQYVEKIVSHRNPYTNKTYGEDETILGWETGNEWGGYINAEEYPPASWTNSIIDSIKKYSKQQFIIDGTNGFYNYTDKAVAPSLNVSRVDVVQDHGYPRNVPLLQAEIAIAEKASKNLWVGEYDWTTNKDKDTLTDYLKLVESSKTIGDSIWSIQGHDDQCCNFVKHEDGFSLYYPNGNVNKTTGALDAGAQANILAVVQHWYKTTGREAPKVLPGVACPQPAF